MPNTPPNPVPPTQAATEALTAADRARQRAAERADRIRQQAARQHDADQTAAFDAARGKLRADAATAAEGQVALHGVDLVVEGEPITLGEAWSIECFVKSSDANETLTQVWSGDHVLFAVAVAHDGLTLQFDGASHAQPTPAGWHHICVSHDGSSVSLWIDRNNLVTFPSDQVHRPLTRVTGSLADLRIWRRALSDAEVTLNGSLPVLTGFEDGLQAIFPILVGDALESADGSTRLRGAPLFERLGRSSVLSLDPALALGDTWTLEANVQFPLPANTYCTLARGPKRLHHVVHYGGKVGYFGAAQFVEAGSAPTGGWHHLAARKRDGKLTFFVDGAQLGNPIAVTDDEPLRWLGNYDKTQSIGAFKDLRVWKVARTDEQLQRTAQGSPAAPREDLLLELPLDDIGQAARDTITGRLVPVKDGLAAPDTPYADDPWSPVVTPNVAPDDLREVTLARAAALPGLARARAQASARRAARRLQASSITLVGEIGAKADVLVDLVNTEDGLPALYSAQPAQSLRVSLAPGGADLQVSPGDQLMLRFRPGALRLDTDTDRKGLRLYRVSFATNASGWSCTDSAFDGPRDPDGLRVVTLTYQGDAATSARSLAWTLRGFAPTAAWGARAIRVQAVWRLHRPNGDVVHGTHQLHLAVVTSSARALQARFLAHQEAVEALKQELLRADRNHAGELAELRDRLAEVNESDQAGTIEAHIDGDPAVLVSGDGADPHENTLRVRLRNVGAHELKAMTLAVDLGAGQWWSTQAAHAPLPAYHWEWDASATTPPPLSSADRATCTLPAWPAHQELVLTISKLISARGPGAARIHIEYDARVGDDPSAEIGDILRLDVACRHMLFNGAVSPPSTTFRESVGIGIMSPSATLDVHGDIKGSGTLTVAGAASLKGKVDIGTTSSTADLALHGTLSVSGDVGIGITSPSAKLDVSGNIKASGTLAVSGTGSSSISGNLGVGTSTPGTFAGLTTGYPGEWSRLHLQGTTSASAVVEGGSNARLHLCSHDSTQDSRHFAITKSNTGDVLFQHLNDTLGVRVDCMTIDTNGFLGIGTTTPKVPLDVRVPHEVRQRVAATGAQQYPNGYYVNANGGDQWDHQTAEYSRLAALFDGDILVNNHLFCQEFGTASDARAKQILARSDARADLQTLMKLAVTDYEWIDAPRNGPGPHKKLIAQEVEAVYPQAVTLMPRPMVVPSVFRPATELAHDAPSGRLTVTTEAPHGFTKEDRIDLYTDRGDLTDIPVLEVLSPQTFVVACDHTPAQVFVYGKYVPDFRTIDYEKVAMLNVSATQELARRVEALEALVVRLLEERAAKA